jgi:hypothetical protein
MRKALSTCAGALATLAVAAQAIAGTSAARVGGTTIRFDADRFKVTSPSPDSAAFAPQGDAAKELATVTVHGYADTDGFACSELARRAFQAGPYDAGEMEASAISVGGVAGMRFATHTRCRNATPRGEVACVKAAGRAYVLAALQAGCGGNPFSEVDPLAEIAAGITFEEAN